MVLTVDLLCLEIAWLAGQLIKVIDGRNDGCLLASVMVDWTGGLYKLTFLLLLLAQMENDVTRSAMFLVQPPHLLGVLLPAQRDDRLLWLELHHGGAHGSAPAAASSAKLMTHSDEKAL